ncbi:MAG: hypothetical protein HY567_03190 [Candidatus Kerfeldbacteria bacterium]|nr:hypothetical protein [Candidatus Kerfeldbacteria bacterium]
MREKSIRAIAAEAGIDARTARQMEQGNREVSELRRMELQRAEHNRVRDLIDDLVEEATGVRLRTHPKRGVPPRPAMAH